MRPIDILKEDYVQTVAFIDKCDNHIFQIRNWAIITSSTVIAFSVSQNHGKFAFANIFILVAFIYMELIYKSFQDTAIDHTTDISERIDKYMVNSETTDLLSKYKHGYGRKLQYPSIMRVFSILGNPKRRHILNFYFLLSAFSVGSFLVMTYAV
jgi:uncharacterized membrane protein